MAVISNNPHPVRVLFTDGAMGGVGRTEVAIHLTTWMQRQGLTPRLIDFAPGRPGSLTRFFPEAISLDAHQPGALDHFFEVAGSGTRVVIADSEAGMSEVFSRWLQRMRKATQTMNLTFTAVGVTSQEPEAIKAILTSVEKFQEVSGYLVVLNEFDQPIANRLKSHLIELGIPTIRLRTHHRVFQAKLRANALTLEDVLERKSNDPYFQRLRAAAKARRYLRQIYGELDSVSSLLLPPGSVPKTVLI